MTGIGIDIVENRRIEKLIERFGDRFIRRIFAPGEIEYCGKKLRYVECYAARFAVKEAFMKALGRGWGRVRFRDIEVINLDTGQPVLLLHGQALELLGNRKAVLSLSHTGTCSVAVVFID